VLRAALLAAAACAAVLVPEQGRHAAAAVDKKSDRAGAFNLLRVPVFRRLMLVSALVLGSHAMHDTFAVIRWRNAGVSPAIASLLWSESAAAEVVVFFFVGPVLVNCLSPAGAMALAAGAGVLPWVVISVTTDVTALALVQPLHGLTFAALHLACMRLIAAIVPQYLAATAQAMYALAAGATTALLTLTSGALYAHLGAQGFLVMALLSAAAVPLTWRLRSVRAQLPPGTRLTRRGTIA
jgi:PPP family 3-phenylpropionic acid transporter